MILKRLLDRRGSERARAVGVGVVGAGALKVLRVAILISVAWLRQMVPSLKRECGAKRQKSR